MRVEKKSCFPSCVANTVGLYCELRRQTATGGQARHLERGNDMETIELSRDDGPDVSFQGEQIASASSYNHQGPRNIRWTELVLYRTAGGKFVCAEVGQTIWGGERTRRGVHIADSAAGLIESLSYGWLAKELYEKAGIDHAEIVE